MPAPKVTLDKFYLEFLKFVKIQDKRWAQNDKRWAQNDKRWAQNDKKLNNIEVKVNKVAKNLDTTIDFFDHEVLDTKRRIRKLERFISN